VTALNDRLSKGVTRANNVMGAVGDAFGPRVEEVLMPAEFYERLGTKKPPDPGDYFQPCFTFLVKRYKLAPAIAQIQMDTVGEGPWTGKEFPHFEGWLKAIDRPLA